MFFFFIVDIIIYYLQFVTEWLNEITLLKIFIT